MRDYSILRTAAAIALDYTIGVSTRCTYTPVSSLLFQISAWYLVRYKYMQAPNKLYKSEVRRSVSRVKTPCERGQPHYAYVLQAEQKATRSFPMERGDPLRSTILRGIRSARSALRRGVSVPLPLGPFLTKKKITIRDLMIVS